MSGGAGCTPNTDADTKTNPRIFTLAFGSCQGWTVNKWGLAKEPLHCADNQNAMGPAYAFGRSMADSLKNDTIGLIPCGLYSRPIECFQKNGNNMGSGGPIPELESGAKNVYNWMLKKIKIAQERGVFAGIILHQGESNSGQKDWVDKVKSIYDDLKKDLNLNKDIPLVAGELLQGNLNPAPCCSGHNPIIDSLPKVLPTSYVASSQGLTAGGSLKQYHFSQDGYRTMGQRMAALMMKGLRETGGLTEVILQPNQKRSVTINTLSKNITTTLYTIDGKKIPAGKLTSIVSGKQQRIYVMQKPGSQASLVIDPN
jgi:hypothetical protein